MSLYDLHLHSGIGIEEESNGQYRLTYDLQELWKNLQMETTGMEMIPGTNPACSFYHLAMGYDSGELNILFSLFLFLFGYYFSFCSYLYFILIGLYFFYFFFFLNILKKNMYI